MGILLHVVVKKFCEKKKLNSMSNQNDFFYNLENIHKGIYENFRHQHQRNGSAAQTVS